jgi:hypothetical protein
MSALGGLLFGAAGALAMKKRSAPAPAPMAPRMAAQAEVMREAQTGNRRVSGPRRSVGFGPRTTSMGGPSTLGRG